MKTEELGRVNSVSDIATKDTDTTYCFTWQGCNLQLFFDGNRWQVTERAGWRGRAPLLEKDANDVKIEGLKGICYLLLFVIAVLLWMLCSD